MTTLKEYRTTVQAVQFAASTLVEYDLEQLLSDPSLLSNEERKLLQAALPLWQLARRLRVGIGSSCAC